MTKILIEGEWVDAKAAPIFNLEERAPMNGRIIKVKLDGETRYFKYVPSPSIQNGDIILALDREGAFQVNHRGFYTSNGTLSTDVWVYGAGEDDTIRISANTPYPIEITEEEAADARSDQTKAFNEKILEDIKNES